MVEPKVALYLRLSREDDDRKSESESIINQRDFLVDFLCQKKWQVTDIYIDDGFSGTSFNRPAFKRMIYDIEAGKIDTVITKDLSRLGRDYIETGHYLERYFPQMGIRYIAVNDGIDTGIYENGNNDMSPFKSVINDMYAKDISKKVRTALTTKKKNGKFIGSFAPFGYMKDPCDKTHLAINEETAPIVREIFKLFLEGNSLIGIAKILTKNKVQTPSQVSGNGISNKRFEGLWNDVIIRRILTNETYIGNLTQNRSRKISYKINKKVNLKREDWIIIQNTHEQIVSKEDFETVALMLSKKAYQRKDRAKIEHLLSGIIFCADCGAPMTFVRESPTRTYLVCSTWRKYGNLKICTSHCIREDTVEEAIRDNLRDIVKRVGIENDIDGFLKENIKKDKYEKQMEKVEHKIEFCKKASLNLYKDKVRGLITDDQFLRLQKSLYNEEKEFESVLQNISTSLDNKNDMAFNKAKILEMINFQKLERNVLLLLVKKMCIYENKKIDIYFTFGNPAM